MDDDKFRLPYNQEKSTDLRDEMIEISKVIVIEEFTEPKMVVKIRVWNATDKQAGHGIHGWIPLKA